MLSKRVGTHVGFSGNWPRKRRTEKLVPSSYLLNSIRAVRKATQLEGAEDCPWKNGAGINRLGTLLRSCRISWPKPPTPAGSDQVYWTLVEPHLSSVRVTKVTKPVIEGNLQVPRPAHSHNLRRAIGNGMLNKGLSNWWLTICRFDSCRRRCLQEPGDSKPWFTPCFLKVAPR